MSLIKTAQYRVRPEALTVVKSAMARYGDQMTEQHPGCVWHTSVDKDDPCRFMTFIALPDAATNDRMATSTETQVFADSLYPNLDGEIQWTSWDPVAVSRGSRLKSCCLPWE